MSEEIEKNEREYSADSIQVLEGLEAVRMRYTKQVLYLVILIHVT